MKPLFIAALIGGSIAVLGCAHDGSSGSAAIAGKPVKTVDVTPDFLAAYNGKFTTADTHESVTIGTDGKITVHQVRDVSSKRDPEIPSPTTCSYEIDGQLEKVTERSAKDSTDAPPHMIIYQVSKIQLTNDLEPRTTSNPGCQTFLKKRLAQISQGHDKYAIFAEPIDHNSIRLQPTEWSVDHAANDSQKQHTNGDKGKAHSGKVDQGKIYTRTP